MASESYCVYCHISPSQKRYVGITSVRPEDRWRKGKGYKTNRVFMSAIKKYGWDSFEHIVLYENATAEFARQKEIELIKRWKTTERRFGYNRDEGGCVHSEETKRKIGAAHAGEKNYWHCHKHTEEYCQNMSKALKGRAFSDEHRERLGAAQSGEKNHRYGKNASPETKKKMSEARRGEKNYNYGVKWTDEQKAAQSNRFKGIYRGNYTEEMRKKMSGENNPVAKRVRCNGVTYGTIQDCATALGLSVTTICPYLTGSRKMPEKYRQMGLAYA